MKQHFGPWRVAALLRAARGRLRLLLGSALLPLMLLGVSPSAHAVDGCKLLLCISGNWKGIPMCVPVVQQALKDLAKGKGWPTCSMSGAGNNGYFSWTNEATCPPFYSNYNPESGAWQSCNYAGVVSVQMNGAWWSDVFVDVWGGSNTSTRYSDAARAQLAPTGQLDPTYDNDAAAYVPPPPPPPEGGGGG